MAIKIGSISAIPGRIGYGTLKLVEHPASGTETVPVILAQGDPRGPTFWITSGLHGHEHAGIQVIHRLVTRELVTELFGTIIALPALNPTGLQTLQRQAYYVDADPNRLFPDGRPPAQADVGATVPSLLEQAYSLLFRRIAETGNYLVDLHNAWIGSVPFVVHDRVFYAEQGTPMQVARARAEATQLDDRLHAMCAASGHSVINEMEAARYLAERLNRTLVGAAVNVARMPALTMELGTGPVPDPAIIGAAVTGLRNLLRWAGMLPGSHDSIDGITVVSPRNACRRHSAPVVAQPCVVHHLCATGTIISPGMPIAEVRDIWGRPMPERVLHSEHSGWIIGRCHGVIYYPGAAIYGLAVDDDQPTVQPYPA